MKNGGFTVVEVLIAVGLISLIFSGFVFFNNLNFALGARLNKASDLRDEIFLLHQMIENPEVCSGLFGGINLSEYRAQYSGNFMYKNSQGADVRAAFGGADQPSRVELVLNPYHPNYGSIVLSLPGTASPLHVPIYVETTEAGVIEKCATRPLIKQKQGGC